MEARRLLKASIARVEHEDVDVFADDIYDDEIARQAEEAMARHTADEAARAADAGDAIDADGSGGGRGEAGAAPGAAAAAAAGGAGGGGAVAGSRRLKTIPYPKFKKIEQSLIVFLRATEPSAGAGLQQKDVVEWYLNQQEDITNVDELASERRLVRQVIQRLLTTDKVLVEVGTPAEAAAQEGLKPHDLRYISVRPHVE